jgi:diguanylate cyclase (GGDEF)-like protein
VNVTDGAHVTRALERSNRALQTLSAANSALMRARSEPELLQEMCNAAVATGTYSMAWVGMVLHDEAKTIQPVAYAGRDTALHTLSFTWDDSESGCGPTGSAVRTAAPVINYDSDTNPNYGPWRALASQYGFKSSIAVPLTDTEGVFGVLSLYADKEKSFDPFRVELLLQLASDISYGVVALRTRAALTDADERSRQHAARLETLWTIVSNPSLSADTLRSAMLTAATAAIRPGQPYFGALGRIQDGRIFYDALAETPEYFTLLGPAAKIRSGRGRMLSGSPIERVLSSGKKTWTSTDLRSDFPNATVVRSLGWQSGILTRFDAGGSTYVLWFASPADTGAWTTQDTAYVEVVASFFAKQVDERFQFDRLHYHQTHDLLTGLLNRSNFRSQARTASLTGAAYAVIALNVNGLGAVNESYGNMIGDALLVEVGSGLSERAAPGEIVGRLGGDVFAVFVPDPPSRDFVRQRALHFSERFRQPFSTGDRLGREFVALTASFGIAAAPDHGSSVDTIISHANLAVSAAKARGRSTTLFYETGMEGDAQRNTQFHNELVRALADDQFELYYQPHVNNATGAISGCEALIRWSHPDRGIVSPNQFIPFAERDGLIGQIDAWVVRQALASARDLGKSYPGFRLYFNLSGRQAGDPDLIHTLTLAARDGLALRNVGVEITESDVMRDLEATRRVCRALRRLGVRVAIDDFGTGFSSLLSLKRLDVDVIKIDRGFISGILHDRHDAALVETIIQMTKLFGCDVLAEGVEEEAEMDWLRRRSCNLVQGYFISHPLPLGDFKKWLEEREGATATFALVPPP